MVVDTSAILAVLFGEEDGALYLDALAEPDRKFMSPFNMLEADIVVHARKGEEGHALLERFIYNCGIETIPFNSAARQLTYEAWQRYGKGRHPASLNMGDCCAYAAARQLRQPLLFKGNDFGKTDIRPFL